jgi:hypothetical protein
MTIERVKVPAVPGPPAVLCYATPPLDGSKGNPMIHCDRKHGHGGRHSWELEGPANADELVAAVEALAGDPQAAARGFGDLVRRNSVLEIIRRRARS